MTINIFKVIKYLLGKTGDMPKIFTDENRDEIRMKLLNNGFKMLKKSGLSAVNIDKLTEETYIAKGTFYNLFENKSEFMYHMMIHERNRAKEKLLSYLNSSGKLTRDSLHDYRNYDFALSMMRRIKEAGINIVGIDFTNPSQWDGLSDLHMPMLQNVV